MSDKKAHRSQKKPARKGSGRPIKPDYREMPFNMKVMLAKAGNDLLHPATMPAALRISGYDGPIPGSILEAPEYGDLNRIRATTILETYTEHAVWIESLRDGVPIDDSSDFFALRWFAESINSRGRFPTIGEIADDRRQTDDERRQADGNRNRKNADYERALKKAFDQRYLLPRVADADLKDIMGVFEANPGVISNESAFRKLVTETKPIYTPVGHWPLDLICHLLVGADIGGLDDESTPVLVPFGLPEYLDVLEWEGFKRAAQKVERRGRDWTQLPATKKAAFRKRLMKTGKQLVAQAVPWIGEGERLLDFTYSYNGKGVPFRIRDEAANWPATNPATSICEHLNLPLIARMLERLDTRNLRLIKKWAEGVLSARQGNLGI